MLPPPPDEAHETEERSGLVRTVNRRDDADDVLAWLDEALAQEALIDVDDEDDDRPTIPVPTPIPSPLPLTPTE